MRRLVQSLALICSASAAPALADTPTLSLPVDCTLGTSCYIEDYVDLDPGPGQRDYMCAVKSRDGHRGTDFHLLSFEAMEAGVDVLAAAPGTVDRVRDGMEDIAVTPETAPDLQDRGCGNAVRIDHGDGWRTTYCHLKNGSVVVPVGAQVEAGTPLGEIGLSGLTNAPHLHLTVLKDGRVVDPFLPVDSNTTCGTVDGPGLWDAMIPYDRAGLFTAAFSDDVPSLDAVKSGDARVADMPTTSAMVLYGFVHFAEPGDLMTLWADGPDGTEVFRTEVQLDDPQLQLFRAFGRRAPAEGWAPGAYRGYVRLTREGRVIAHRHADLAVTSP
ncbi:MAG: M23 family metallopeptidase [Pseudomonadota bacterium]